MTGPLDQPGPWSPQGGIAVADSDLAGEPATIAERVARGTAWLDEHDPGWWREDAPPRPGRGASRPISLYVLDMADPCGCILGRRWGHYGDAVRESDLVEHVDALGFYSQHDGSRAIDEYAALTAEWTRVIRARRAEVTGDG